jgi:hypothetical protein
MGGKAERRSGVWTFSRSWDVGSMTSSAQRAMQASGEKTKTRVNPPPCPQILLVPTIELELELELVLGT